MYNIAELTFSSRTTTERNKTERSNIFEDYRKIKFRHQLAPNTPLTYEVVTFRYTVKFVEFITLQIQQM